VNGIVSTIGTLNDLKKKYDDYLIVMEGAEQKHVSDIDRTIKDLFPKAKLDPNPDDKGLVFKVKGKNISDLTH